jgi:hypothetical protein
MVGFILACLGHRNRAVAGSNPALPTNFTLKAPWLVWFFLVLDDGKTFYTHLLLGGFEGACFFVSASSLDCRLVVVVCASRVAETEDAKQPFYYPLLNSAASELFIYSKLISY